MKLLWKVLPFLSGFGLATVIIAFLIGSNLENRTSHVPEGDFASLVISRGLNFQIDTDSSVDPTTRRMTTWIREDHDHPFLSDTGLIGETIFTHITIDCSKLQVAIHEQRVFKGDMTFIDQAKGDGIFKSPTTLVGLTTILLLCPPPNEPETHATPSIIKPKAEVTA